MDCRRQSSASSLLMSGASEQSWLNGTNKITGVFSLLQHELALGQSSNLVEELHILFQDPDQAFRQN